MLPMRKPRYWLTSDVEKLSMHAVNSQGTIT